MSELLIDGEWRAARSGGTRDLVNPADATVLQTVDEAGAEDAEVAVLAARRAFDEGDWFTSFKQKSCISNI